MSAKPSDKQKTVPENATSPEPTQDELWKKLQARIHSWSGIDELAIQNYLNLELDRVLKVASRLEPGSSNQAHDNSAVVRAMDLIAEAEKSIRAQRHEILVTMNVKTLKRLAVDLGIEDLHKVASDYKSTLAYERDSIRSPIIWEMRSMIGQLSEIQPSVTRKNISKIIENKEKTTDLQRPEMPCTLREALGFVVGDPNASKQLLLKSLTEFVMEMHSISAEDLALPPSFTGMAAMVLTKEIPDQWLKLQCPDPRSLVWLIRRFGRFWHQVAVLEKIDLSKEKYKQRKNKEQKRDAQRGTTFATNKLTFDALGKHAVRFSEDKPIPSNPDEFETWLEAFGTWLPKNKAGFFEEMTLGRPTVKKYLGILRNIILQPHLDPQDIVDALHREKADRERKDANRNGKKAKRPSKQTDTYDGIKDEDLVYNTEMVVSVREILSGATWRDGKNPFSH